MNPAKLATQITEFADDVHPSACAGMRPILTGSRGKCPSRRASRQAPAPIMAGIQPAACRLTQVAAVQPSNSSGDRAEDADPHGRQSTRRAIEAHRAASPHRQQGDCVTRRACPDPMSLYILHLRGQGNSRYPHTHPRTSQAGRNTLPDGVLGADF
ncbi:hypothetical protein DCS_01900 [Drechmeria coniospora]|uniref:Uncharacterized protein n=1 Tax=Drechmeria coniospora TaxID=98403 RepID=A0A151GUR6_DRECN|nr:hypothetical protein DCS_01900 [Drechmeria coniospora]KYK60762.1 hypothetical protein DCS_01900 [Drechmeria coniospora]